MKNRYTVPQKIIEKFALPSLLSLIILLGSQTMNGQDSRMWTGNDANDPRVFNPSNQGVGATKNWEAISGSNGGGINDKALVVDSITHVDGLLLSSGGSSPYSLEIRAGANGFKLSPGGGTLLTVKNNLTVAANTTATFDVGVSMNTTTGSSLTINVGEGGAVYANGGIGANATNGVLTKTGKGRLEIGNPRTIKDSTVSFKIEEGTIYFNHGSEFGVSNSPFATILGTASTAATVEGRGVAYTSLSTVSAANSTVVLKGDWRVSNVNFTNGATVSVDFEEARGYTLAGDLLTFGSENILFNFTGAEVGQTYDIFNFGSVTGFDASHFIATGYEDSIWSNNGGVISVQVVPEPSTMALIMLLPILALFQVKHRISARK